jgi:hypothetical protein
MGRQVHKKEWSMSVRNPAGKNTFEVLEINGRNCTTE